MHYKHVLSESNKNRQNYKQTMYNKKKISEFTDTIKILMAIMQH